MGNDNRRRRRPRRAMTQDHYQPQGDAEKLALELDALGLSERTRDALAAGGIRTARDIAARRMSQMYRIQNFGKKNCIEVQRKLAELGLDFRPEDAPQPSGAPAQADASRPSDQRPPRADRRSREPRPDREDRNAQPRADRPSRTDRAQDTRRGRQDDRRRMRNERNRRPDPEQEERRRRIAQIYQVNKGLNDSLSRQYAGMTINEILQGKRTRPVVARAERPPLTPESLVKFCRKGSWGYKDWKGNVLIAPTFDEAYPFSEGLACVEKDGKLGYIDRNGDIVIDYRYDTATNFCQGLASVTLGDKSGYIDPQGNQVIDFIFEIATAFADDKAIVYADGRWGVLNRETLKVFWR